MFRRLEMMAAVLAVGGLFSWLAASARMDEVFAQAPNYNSTSDGGTPKVLPGRRQTAANGAEQVLSR
jgi:hypothetical protein